LVKTVANLLAVQYIYVPQRDDYAIANYTHLYPKRTVGNGIASEEYIDGMDSQLGGHVVAPDHRDKNVIFCAIFVEKMCLRSHIPYQSDRPKRGEWNAVSCATLQ
jgi:hypothetical protein